MRPADDAHWQLHVIFVCVRQIGFLIAVQSMESTVSKMKIISICDGD